MTSADPTDCTVAARTCPDRTAPGEIDRVRKRSTMPWAMSIATEVDVPWAIEPMVSRRMPGQHVVGVVAPGPRRPRPGGRRARRPSVPPKTKTKSSRKISGIARTMTVISG